jgi:rSAM/selenodomain-associated transferase 2
LARTTPVSIVVGMSPPTDQRRWPGLTGLTAVIPTLNAASTLPATLASLGEIRVVVVDGGSTDATAAIARAGCATVVAASPGRGTQLAAGAAASGSGWLLFLHGDTVLGQDWREAADRFICEAGSRERAATFALKFDDRGIVPRLFEMMVAFRVRVFGLPYGDQGLLVHSELLDSVGGYRALPLMEDVDLVRRIGRRRLRVLDAIATTSASRYRQDGYWRRAFRNLTCLAMYFAGAAPERIARYYGR